MNFAVPEYGTVASWDMCLSMVRPARLQLGLVLGVLQKKLYIGVHLTSSRYESTPLDSSKFKLATLSMHGQRRGQKPRFPTGLRRWFTVQLGLLQAQHGFKLH